MSATNLNELKAMIGRLSPHERLLYAAQLMKQLPDISNAHKVGACVAIAYICGRTAYECADAGKIWGQMAAIDQQAKQAAAESAQRKEG